MVFALRLYVLYRLCRKEFGLSSKNLDKNIAEIMKKKKKSILALFKREPHVVLFQS